jgi:hypothetical protein
VTQSKNGDGDKFIRSRRREAGRKEHMSMYGRVESGGGGGSWLKCGLGKALVMLWTGFSFLSL